MKNMKPSLFARMLLSFAALSAVGAPNASATVTNYVGGCAGSPNFTTISAALASTPAPNVVEVCPGTYPEQILITNPVTLEGIFTSNADQVVITVPSGGLSVSNVCSETAGPVQVCVAYTGTVNISNVTVDGSGAAVSGGILYLSSSGTLNQIETRFQEGEGDSMGIGFIGYANTVTVKNSNLHDFGNIGILVQDNSASGDELTATIEGNTLVPDPTASFGILTNRGKSVTVSGNSIDGPSTPSCKEVGCAGIRVSQTASAGSVSKNKVFGVGSGGAGITILSGAATMSVTSNTVFDIAGDGIQLYVAGLKATGNNLMQVQNGINLECNADSSVTGNTMTAIHSVGLANVPSGAIPVNYYYDAPTLYSTCP